MHLRSLYDESARICNSIERPQYYLLWTTRTSEILTIELDDLSRGLLLIMLTLIEHIPLEIAIIKVHTPY
jgi:hypothetical protein